MHTGLRRTYWLTFCHLYRCLERKPARSALEGQASRIARSMQVLSRHQNLRFNPRYLSQSCGRFTLSEGLLSNISVFRTSIRSGTSFRSLLWAGCRDYTTFSPELSNPLFLHLACKTLKGEGRDNLDISLPGFTSLFQGHLKHCDVLIREHLHYANPRNLVRAAMMALANTLTHELPQNRTSKPVAKH